MVQNLLGNSTLLLLLVSSVIAICARSTEVAVAFIVATAANGVIAWRQQQTAAGLFNKSRQQLLKSRGGRQTSSKSPIQKQLQSQATRAFYHAILLETLLFIVAWLAGFDHTTTLTLTLALLAALTPSGVALATAALVHYSEPRLTAASVANALFCSLSDSAAEVLIVVISIVGIVAWHVPLAIGIVQLLAINILLLALPVSTLAWDDKAHVKREHWRNMLGFGLTAAALAYANYAFFFTRNGLSPRYASTNNPYYFKATALAMVTLVFCQGINLLIVRADKHEHFFTDHLWSNTKLLWAFCISLFIILNLLYNPLARSFFNTGPLTLLDWLWAFVATVIYLGLRILQRHTRKHTHNEVLKLHRAKQVN